MRNLIFIGMLVSAAFMAGWLKIQKDGETTLIEINRAEIREDARVAIDRGREILDRERQLINDRSAKNQSPWSPQPGAPLATSSPWATEPPPYDSRGYTPQYPQSSVNQYDQNVPYRPSSYQQPQQPYQPPYQQPYQGPYQQQPYDDPTYPVSPSTAPVQAGPYSPLPDYPSRR